MEDHYIDNIHKPIYIYPMILYIYDQYLSQLQSTNNVKMISKALYISSSILITGYKQRHVHNFLLIIKIISQLTILSTTKSSFFLYINQVDLCQLLKITISFIEKYISNYIVHDLANNVTLSSFLSITNQIVINQANITDQYKYLSTLYSDFITLYFKYQLEIGLDVIRKKAIDNDEIFKKFN